MRATCAAALLLSLSVASVGCHSNDPERCPSGDRTTQPTKDFADLGYPDGMVACVGHGLDTPVFWYNGIDSDQAAAANLTAFMTSKGYQAKPQPTTKSDLEAAEKGRGVTRLLFVKDGTSVRYYAVLATSKAHAVSLSFSRTDCAVTPRHYECDL